MPRSFVVILAGGKGERFWPLSRHRTPKQLLPIVGRTSMLAQTVARVRPLVPARNILVITNADQAQAVRRACPGLPAANVVGEPMGRDSAPAVALAAALVQARDPEGVFAILAADHVIRDAVRFRQDLKAAFAAASSGDVLVTIGIRPTEPNTGYGYIKAGGAARNARAGRTLPVRRFVEKPDRKTAEGYLAEGGYFWNAGMFVWSAPAIMEAFAAHAPSIHRGLAPVREALARGRPIQAALRRCYPRLERISVDYAILEKAGNVAVLPARFDWDDVGSWPALARHIPADSAGNVVRGQGFVEQGRNNIVQSAPGHLTAVFGVDGLVVVHTPDATLVCPRGRSQDIKQLLKRLAGDPSARRAL